MWFIRFSYLFGGDHSLWSSYWNLLRFIDQAASPNPPHLPRIRNRGAEGYSRRGERHIIAVKIRPKCQTALSAERDWVPTIPRDCALIDRKRVVYGKSVDLGGRRIIKKKKANLRGGRRQKAHPGPQRKHAHQGRCHS